MTTSVEQKEYLKKYLASAKALKKRKRIKKRENRIKIIDDDLDLITFNEAVTEDLTGGEIEDAPQIVGVMDERPPELCVNDYKTEMWKSVTILDSDEEDDAVKAMRKRNINQMTPPKVKIEPSDSDNNLFKSRDINSLPKQRNYDLNDNSPPRKTSVTNTIISPTKIDGPRKNNNSSSPRHKSNRDYSSDDNNPPRKTKQDFSSLRNYKSQGEINDLSSKTYNKKSSEKNEIKNDKTTKTKLSKWNKDDRGSDNSPPRKPTNGSDDDNSPPRPRGNKDKVSPPRISRNISIPTRNAYKRKDNDNTLPRTNRSDRYESLPKRHKYEFKDHDRSDVKRDDKTNRSRVRDDRYSGRDLNEPSSSKDNNERGRIASEGHINDNSNILETSSFKKDKSIISRGSQDVNLNLVKAEAPENNSNVPITIVRDRKTGRIRNLREDAIAKLEKEKEKAAIQEKYSRWGKGLKQVEDANEKHAQDLHEMQKPLARYADDADLEDMLKNREREGDPMLEYLRKKKREKAKNDPNAKPEKPIYQGDYGLPNRYGIKPGYRWDGVDRSNGFEKKYFEVQNARRAHQAESYKWSSEDM